MGASKRHKVCSVDGIVAALRPNRLYQVGNLSRAYGVETKHMRNFLEAAVAEGLIDKVKYHGETCYRLVGSDSSGKTTPAPYRTLNLDKDLQGYDEGLRSFASLCMEVRK